MAISKASDFKAQPVELPLPSGNTCLARRKTLDVFLKRGSIPNSLLALIQRQMDQVDGREVKPADLTDMMEDPKALGDIIALADAVVCECVVEPRVYPTPKNEEERDDELLYADEVDLDDKMFVFSWATGGTKDLERFRDQSARALEDISSGKEDWSEAERPSLHL